MPRRERDREIARRRKRKKERKKLRAKGLLPPPAETVKAEAAKEVDKKKPEKPPVREKPPVVPQDIPKPEEAKEGAGTSTPEA
jgi:hypothetical protein